MSHVSKLTFTPARTTRRSLLGVTTATGVLAIGGCGRTPTGTDGRRTAGSGEPRIVALGSGKDADAAVALGVVPLAVPRSRLDPSGLTPWLRDALGERRTDTLEVGADLPLERIAAYRPELILATGYYAIERHRRRLERLGTLVAPVRGPNVDAWRFTTRRIGRLVDRRERAERVIARTERRLAGVRRDHAELAGRTFTYSAYAGGRFHTKCSPDDVIATSLAEMGLRLSDAVRDLPESGTQGLARLSMESVERIDADLTLVLCDSAEERRRLVGSAPFRRLASVRDGRYVALTGAQANALAFPTVLSLRHTIDHTVPRLSAALRDGVDR